MLIETYEDEASSTMPPTVHLDSVRPGVIFAALNDFIRAGENLNRLIKKPFVYGPSRTIEEDQDHPYVGAVDIDPPAGNIDPALAHGIIGVATEAAELVELLVKTWFFRQPLDGVNAKEEIGDVLWYLVRIARARGVDTGLEEAMKANIAKLANRHKRDGKTFNPDADKTRDLAAERALLEADTTDAAGRYTTMAEINRLSIHGPAIEAKGISCLERFDDGSEVWLEAYAGGASPGGLFSALSTVTYLSEDASPNQGIIRRYVRLDSSSDESPYHQPIEHERIERIGDIEVRHRIYGGQGKPIPPEEAEKLFAVAGNKEYTVFHPKVGEPLLINKEGGPVRTATMEEQMAYRVNEATFKTGKFAPPDAVLKHES